MLTLNRLRAVLAYHARDGEWVWLKGGYKAGSIDKQSGYRIVSVDREQYRSGRLAYFYVHGRWPLQIDHKDGNPSNDAWSNLREASGSQNCMNRRGRPRFKGVDLHRGRWRARLRVDGKLLDLGYFESDIAAATAYDIEAINRYGVFARVNFGGTT